MKYVLPVGMHYGGLEQNSQKKASDKIVTGFEIFIQLITMTLIQYSIRHSSFLTCFPLCKEYYTSQYIVTYKSMGVNGQI
jgi:hypothetical protein